MRDPENRLPDDWNSLPAHARECVYSALFEGIEAASDSAVRQRLQRLFVLAERSEARVKACRIALSVLGYGNAD